MRARACSPHATAAGGASGLDEVSARVSFSSREIAPPLGSAASISRVLRRRRIPRCNRLRALRPAIRIVNHRDRSQQSLSLSTTSPPCGTKGAHLSSEDSDGLARLHIRSRRAAPELRLPGGDLHKTISPPALDCSLLFAAFLHPSSYCHARRGPRPYAAPCWSLVWRSSWPRTPRATSTPCRPNPSCARRPRIILRGYHQEQR